MKIQFIRMFDVEEVMNETNDFIKDKKVIDIKYNETKWYETKKDILHRGIEQEVLTSVMIMYEESEVKDE